MEARFPQPRSRTQAGAPDATSWHQIAQRTIVPLLGLLLTLPITLLALTTLMPAPGPGRYGLRQAGADRRRFPRG